MGTEQKKSKDSQGKTPNRHYSGPVSSSEIARWAESLRSLSDSLSASAAAMEGHRMPQVRVFGREIVKGTQFINAWVAKVEAEVSAAVRAMSF